MSEIHLNNGQGRNVENLIYVHRLGVDMAKVYTGEDYVKPLMTLFKKEERRGSRGAGYEERVAR